MKHLICLLGTHRWQPRWLSFELYLGDICQRCGAVRQPSQLEKAD